MTEDGFLRDATMIGIHYWTAIGGIEDIRMIQALLIHQNAGHHGIILARIVGDLQYLVTQTIVLTLTIAGHETVSSEGGERSDIRVEDERIKNHVIPGMIENRAAIVTGDHPVTERSGREEIIQRSEQHYVNNKLLILLILLLKPS
jgi:hypothetical protein